LRHNSSRSLTVREEAFLHHVLQSGTEVQVQRAQSTLMNDNLFFVDEGEKNDTCGDKSEDDDDDDDDDKLVRLACDGDVDESVQENDSKDDDSSLEDGWEKKIDALAQLETSDSVMSSASTSSAAVGSKQRQELLELRKRDSRVYNHMWKAHEHIGTRHSHRHVLSNSSTNSNSSSSATTATTTKASTSATNAAARSSINIRRHHHRHHRGSIRSSASSRSSSSSSISSSLQLQQRHRLLRSSGVSGISSCCTSSFSTTAIVVEPTRAAVPNLEQFESTNSSSTITNNHNKRHSCSLKALKEGQGDENDDEDGDDPCLNKQEEQEEEAILAAALAFGQTDHNSLIFYRTCANDVEQGEGFELLDINDDENNKNDLQRQLTSSSSPPPATVAALPHLVFMRRASAGIYQGEGVEVADLPSVQHQNHHHYHHRTCSDPSLLCAQENSKSDKDNTSSVKFVSACDVNDDDLRLRLTSTFDETMSYERVSAMFRFHSSSMCIQRTLSDDALILNRQEIMDRMPRTLREMMTDTTSNKDANTASTTLDYYDSWLSIDDAYVAIGNDGDLSVASPSTTVLHDLHILGTSANDQEALPHVLSPPLMASLQAHLPWGKRGESMLLKFSLVRDGASLFSFLKHARAATSSILAIETVDGEVFGAFTSSHWHKSGSQYFGSGESFLWRMQHSRKEKTCSVLDQCRLESKIDVFPFSHNNQYVQICSNDMLAVGGGTGDTIDAYTELPDVGVDPDHDVHEHEYGAGLYMTGDLLRGTTSPCLTYSSPSLSKEHADGSLFEVINLELWSLTPCITLQEAEKLELNQLFLNEHGHFTND
jgi:TLD